MTTYSLRGPSILETPTSPGTTTIILTSDNSVSEFRRLSFRLSLQKAPLDHTTYDHTSVLASVETLFKLGTNETEQDGANRESLVQASGPQNRCRAEIR
jgi:hypothetical protein